MNKHKPHRFRAIPTLLAALTIALAGACSDDTTAAAPPEETISTSSPAEPIGTESPEETSTETHAPVAPASNSGRDAVSIAMNDADDKVEVDMQPDPVGADGPQSPTGDNSPTEPTPDPVEDQTP